jgi:hypothetical protein
MAYLGNSNLVQNFTPAVDYFNGNGSATAFTLSRTVGSSFDIQAFIENVPQNPSSAFTVAGNVITFTSAPPSGTNNIYVRYTSPVVQQVKPAPGTVGPTELNSAYSLWNLSGADINYTAGNVGIGTSTPTQKLTIAGSTSIGTASVSGNASIFQAPGSLYLTLNTNGTLSGNRRNWSISPEYDVAGGLSFMVGVTEGASPTSTKMLITSGGNVGIGTTSPSNPLHIVNSGANINLLNLIGTNTYTGTGLQGEGPFRLQNTNTTNGNMTSISNYDGNGNINTQLHFININQSGDGAIAFTTRTGGSYSERMRVTESGGTRFQCENYNAQPSSTNGGVEINNTNAGSTMFGFGTGTETHIAFGNRNGIRGTIQTTSGGTSYNTTSDYRLKENITPMTGALAKVAQLNPVNYNWKVGGSGQGFIAHELQEIVPDAVTGEKDAVDENDEPKYQMVDTSFLVATLTAAIQEQQAIIEDLKTRIEILENK